MTAADTDEPEVRFDDPMPEGYEFVPKGDVYVTKNCRKTTHEAEKTLYVVLDRRNKPVGLRCPSYIYSAVMGQNKATATQRAAAVQKRDTAIEENFEEAIVKLFPEVPKEEVPKIIKHSLQKHSRRVGRTSRVDLEDRVHLAVRAHIRHVHTDYDHLLRQGASRAVAREKVWDRLNEVARQWGGRPLKPAAAVPAKERRGKKNKTRKGSRRKTKTNGAVKKAVICGIRANSEHTGLRVRTRSMTSKLRSLRQEDTPMMDEGGLDVDVDGFVEDADAQGVVFTGSKDTSDYDSDGSGWIKLERTASTWVAVRLGFRALM
ncbi:hypothetical protein C8A00DRAFT_44305 [Chaetomidium leptoderma]|uniref:DUF2293 domain-containing protein n=1 Tax=Chaetomidium leptoderma TaxID=669021 RepID=A0AAN6VKU2_9PEZI|nr:hypothetical protein C8A00DRAFT_44305 [Chaetomidium leptoderma]